MPANKKKEQVLLMTLSKVIFPVSHIEFSNYSNSVIRDFKSMYSNYGFRMHVVQGANRLIVIIPFTFQLNKQRMKTRYFV